MVFLCITVATRALYYREGLYYKQVSVEREVQEFEAEMGLILSIMSHEGINPVFFDMCSGVHAEIESAC